MTPRAVVAQLLALRAQLTASLVTIDALVEALSPEGPPKCCEKQELLTEDTYTKRTVKCRNCGHVLSELALNGAITEERGG